MMRNVTIELNEGKRGKPIAAGREEGYGRTHSHSHHVDKGFDQI